MSSRPNSIGPFRVRRTISQTKTSTTYLTIDRRDSCAASVTVLHLDVSQRPHAHRQFNRLARELQKWQHPAILPMLDFGDANNQPYVATPYIAVNSIRDELEVTPLSVAETIALLKVVVPPLDIAHRLRLFHRDILPHQILRKPDGTVLWRNFGLATLFEWFHSRQAPIPYGSCSNMAPEIIKGQKTTVATDIYQLGVMVFQMVTGWLPFNGPNHVLIRKHLSSQPPQASELNPRLSPAIGHTISKAMAKSPEERHASAGAFLDELIKASS